VATPLLPLSLTRCILCSLNLLQCISSLELVSTTCVVCVVSTMCVTQCVCARELAGAYGVCARELTSDKFCDVAHTA
jgi:hypothetical protein